MEIRLVALSLLFAFGLAPPATAHPHVWVDVKAEVSVAAGYVDGVWTTWTFDDVFSQLILADHDTDGNGKLDDQESLGVKKGYFDNLKGYQYFVHLGLGTKRMDVPEPQRFQAGVSTDGRVTYRFFLPLALRLDAKTPLAVSFYDESFFTDMVFEKTNPLVLKVTGGRATVSLKKDSSQAYYGGQVTPIYAFILWSPS
jgi:ABC-type uncharacterized transport system substrate-binding protein